MIEFTDAGEFHLSNGLISYIFRIDSQTQCLEQLYFGKAIKHRKDFFHLIEREIRPSNNLAEGTQTSSLEHIKQEYPLFGTTDFRYPAVELLYADGDSISAFDYQDHVISCGKKKVTGQPASFGDTDDVELLQIRLKDRYSDIELYLAYAIYKKLPVITRWAKIKNTGQISVQLKRFLSMSLDLPNEQFEMLSLDGAWARETQVSRRKIYRGVQSVSSTRGASSHVHNPFLALCTPETTEKQGNVYGFSLVYSGNFLAQVELDSYDVARITLGINPFQFSWKLSQGETFTSPEAVMTYSEDGLNGMSQSFHEFYRRHLMNTRWCEQPRPVLINNWEATYFDFNEDKILEIAKEAKTVGADLLVLDDGWFGRRNSDNGSLGDWTVDQLKLPSGLNRLSNSIHELGLLFGLWFEPEMVSKDTLLYAHHSDWILGHPEKNISHGRNQYVLDFSNPIVVETIFQQMDAILSSCQIDYLKWDMNRYISEAFSTIWESDRQGEVCHRYILGVYDLYERLLAKYPDLLIESCAGGGGRFDPALLYYAPQTWASDDTDAVERLHIQYGASMVYPLSSIGSHVSAVPNHQVARLTSLKMRGDVAYFGTFGYELDITQCTVEEKSTISQQIQQFKKHQKLIHSGKFYRLLSPFGSNEVAWMVVSHNQQEALVGYYQILARPNPKYYRLKLAGLNENYQYTVSGQGVHCGDELMSIGLLFGENYIGRETEYWQRDMKGDFNSRLIYLKAENQ